MHIQTCKRRKLRSNFLFRFVCREPDTKGLSFGPDTSQSLARDASGSQSVRPSADGFQESSREYRPEPSRTIRSHVPRNSATIPFADWPNAAVSTHPNRDRED